MFKTIKKVWRYVGRYKKLLIFSIIMMIIVQVLNLLAPLIVKEILDNQLVMVENVWYEIDFEDENSIIYNNKTYSIKDESNNGISILIYKNNYYVIDEIIDLDLIKGSKEIVFNNNSYDITLNDNNGNIKTFNGIKLNKDEIKSFYRPFISPLIILIILLAVRLFLQILATFAQRISSARLTINMVKDARLDAVRVLQKSPIKYYEDEPAGKIANRVITDVSGLMGLYSTVMNLVLNATMSVVFAYIGMFYLNTKLALISFIIFPVVYIWLKVFIKNLNSIAKKANEQASLITASLNEIINGVSILQIFNYKDETVESFNQISKSYVKEHLKESKLHLSLGWNMIRLIGALVSAAIVFYFGNIKLLGAIVTAGTIYAYNTYLLGVIEPVSILFREIGNLQHSIVRTERFFKIIDGEQESDEDYYINKYLGKIKFENVWFSYTKGVPVLKGVSFDILENEMVGIVGHTGSGKSTLMNLLLRFYDLDSAKGDIGNIYIDDVNINTYPKRTYRRPIGIILQDPKIFSGTLAENIKFGVDVSDQEVIDVLNEIGGKNILEKFNNNINEPIDRGGQNLSVGEKQIISFARVLIHDPSILIMDEATANIDTETEVLIQNALKHVKKNRTVIIIAHRLSTIKDANKIIVLDHGIKVEEGTHNNLLKNNNIYANMYRSQVKI